MVTSEKCDPSGSYCTHCSGHEHLCPNGDGRLRYPARRRDHGAAAPSRCSTGDPQVNPPPFLGGQGRTTDDIASVRDEFSDET